MSFVERQLAYSFQLGAGDFGDGSSDTVELIGLRSSFNVTHAGGNSLAQASMQVWGVPRGIANQVTVLNVTAFPERRNNRVTVKAGDAVGGMAVVFTGTIVECWVEATDPPEVALVVSAASGLFEAAQPAAPTSYAGSVDVATIISGIAVQMGYSFQNCGVTAKLDSPYYPGTLKSQLNAAAEAAHINRTIDDVERKVVIWPKGNSITSPSLLISKDTGLVGYPSFTEQGIQFRTIFNPGLSYGQAIEMQSELDPANGAWVVGNVSHNLDSLVPGGQWFTEVECGLLGHPIPIR